MADYQSKFTGEEIDELLQKVKDGSDDFIVDLICDVATMSVTSISKTHAEIYSALQNGEQLLVRADFGFSFGYGSVASLGKSSSDIWFQLMIPTTALTGTMALYYFTVVLSPNNRTVVYPFIVNTTSIGG